MQQSPPCSSTWDGGFCYALNTMLAHRASSVLRCRSWDKGVNVSARIAELIQQQSVEREHAELAARNYEAYLQTEQWQWLRAERIRIDGYRCRMCNSKATQVHHRTYERIGFEQLDDLTSVCDSCHELFHRGQDEAGN